MANAWGELSWNNGLWGEQSNAIAAPTGFELNTAQGSAAGYPFPGWGSLSWSSGQWGDITNFNVEVTGQQLSSSTSNVGVSTEINSGWGRLTFGENAWGIAGDLLVTGIGLSTNIGVGSVTATAESAVTGQQLPLTLDSVIATGLAEVFPTGFDLTSNVGTVDAGPDAMLVGVQASASLGTLDAYNETGWGRLTFGSEVWGATGYWATAELTGIQLSANLGTAVLDAVSFIDVTGNSLTVTEGIADPSPDATVTGIGLTASLSVGSVIEADANTDVTGNSLSVTSGIRETWGQYEWGATTTEWGGNSITAVGILSIISPTGQQLTVEEGIVDPSPDATVVGIGLSAAVAIGSLIEADANVTSTGNQLSVTSGVAEADANTFAETTGQQLEFTLNNAVAGASAEVQLTGNALTVGLRNINVQAWQIVNTGTNVNWNIIDTAA